MAKQKDGWFRSLMGHALMGLAGGAALLFGFLWLTGVDGIPWWVWLVGLVVCGLLALWSDHLRTHYVEVDPDTGRVRKNNL